MKTVHVIMAMALLVGLAPDFSLAFVADPSSSYVVLYSSNVAGEIEPCG